MNNKGFTLIELLATIALLAVISVISFVSINEVTKKSKINDCKSLVGNIKSAAKEYMSDNRYNNDVLNGITGNNVISIDASVLVDGNYLLAPIVNPFDNMEINSENIKINIKLRDDYTVLSLVVKNSSGMEVNCENERW